MQLLVWSLRRSRTTQKHKIDILSSYKADLANRLANSCLFMHLHMDRATLVLIQSLVSAPSTNINPNVTLF